MSDERSEAAGPSFEDLQQSFYDGDHADMQFKYLARTTDEAAAAASSRIIAFSAVAKPGS